ncbi:unnamed protein product [Cuscuta europaea]|uniref:SWIM-type domain-containing protein n=1 Tax=Cuscuta europaea TaxID=41803 RepID=A0A9P0ZGJ3_CUSEU|nr:unnamed protein product [Cuscuta europaea]
MVTGVITWKECLAESVAWDTLTWFAALIAMANYLNKYGLISWFSETVVKIIFNGDDGYEVKCGSCQYKVRLHASTCSCRAWDLSGIPCPHVVYAISYKGDDAEQYVDHCNFKQVYQRIYSYHLQPMNEELLWTRTQNNDIVPPIPKKLSSRPKKKRTR